MMSIAIRIDAIDCLSHSNLTMPHRLDRCSVGS